MRYLFEYISCVAMFVMACAVTDRLPFKSISYLKKDIKTPLKTLLLLNMITLMIAAGGLLLSPWITLWERHPVRCVLIVLGLIGCVMALAWHDYWRMWVIVTLVGCVLCIGALEGGIPPKYEVTYWLVMLNYLPTVYLFFASEFNDAKTSMLSRRDVQLAATLFVVGHLYLYWPVVVATLPVWAVLSRHTVAIFVGIMATVTAIVLYVIITRVSGWLDDRRQEAVDAYLASEFRAPHELPLKPFRKE